MRGAGQETAARQYLLDPALLVFLRVPEYAVTDGDAAQLAPSLTEEYFARWRLHRQALSQMAENQTLGQNARHVRRRPDSRTAQPDFMNQSEVWACRWSMRMAAGGWL